MKRETKRCKWCGRELPITDFYLKPGTRIPKCNKCKECYRKEQRRRYRDKKKGKVKRYRTAAEIKLASIPEWSNETLCDSCIYRTPVGRGDNACYYIVIRGERRPCEAGNKCKVYEEGPALPLPNNLKFPGALI